MAATKPTTVSKKLLIDPKSDRILFAEAGKDFVDFLFYIMSLPVGTVVRLLGKQRTVGCLGNIYESIENLNDYYYMKSAATKVILLKPMSKYTNLYWCKNHQNYNGGTAYVANHPTAACPSCGHYFMKSNDVLFVNPTNNGVPDSGEEAFIKRAATFMILDDLVVRPMYTNSIITLLDKFNIKDVNDLEEKTIGVGVNEAVELLRASMQSKTVLTDVFLGGKKKSSEV
ncbi:hypothetical protein ERO13_D10G220060v2 [Gossypium hirsutum]|uniref:DUF674 domain-containing protein n=3 Tax=Gossypium TaxID=3633 RepID=A0A5J5PVE7_GOSBA|nr:hypothetical protein ES319_D10G247300v1 [Gossypium barbadense]KAG4127515.1 hypothetical protein ERO13_D10G220060v2 [Gossypium hirsutum]TYG51561.1 hypothetical protein ES288_D10G267500v1 [Gossypium darwinii]TYH51388.1 hypothetical protein ES332_D10G269600v1 [Gossypium tomentosum]